MKKLITPVIALALCVTFAAPAFAADYTFGSGPNLSVTFGKSTGVGIPARSAAWGECDEPVTGDPLATNERRDKNAALLPPPFGVFSGDIPTDASSLYHDGVPAQSQIAWGGGNTPSNAGSGYGGGSPSGSAGSSGISLPDAPGMLPSTSVSVSQNTAPKYNADGSIGTLYITKLKKTIKVYEGEELSNLAKGAGHFASTSAWDGNCALAGHNRGSSAYFSFVKDLEPGDTVTYTTPYGSRTYAVISKNQIGEYDRTGLDRSSENLLTLITCIADVPELRWQAVLREVK
jgi:sortase A